jgi:hypothetical protein
MPETAFEQIQPHYIAHRSKIIAGEFCNPEGGVAIVTPLVTRHNKEKKTRKELACYHRDASNIADQLTEEGISVVDARGASDDDMTSLLGDDHIRGMFLIGNGSYNGIDTSGGTYGWADAAETTGGLKEFVVQRTCGVVRNEVNLPFGTFVVSDQRHVVAPKYGCLVPDDDPDDSYFFQPFHRWNNTPGQLMEIDRRLQIINGPGGLELGTITLSLVNFIRNAVKKNKD